MNIIRLLMQIMHFFLVTAMFVAVTLRVLAPVGLVLLAAWCAMRLFGVDP